MRERERDLNYHVSRYAYQYECVCGGFGYGSCNTEDFANNANIVDVMGKVIAYTASCYHQMRNHYIMNATDTVCGWTQGPVKLDGGMRQNGRRVGM